MSYTTPAPTETEIDALAAQHLDAVHQFGRLWIEGEVEFARAVLAKWGAQPAASPAPVVAREPVAWASGDWLRAITETELALIPNTGHDKGRRDRCRAMYRIPLYADHGITSKEGDTKC